MTGISYRVIPRGKGGFDVEMERPDGRRQTVPGFHSEHEAEAWIIQAKRLIRDASPLVSPTPRKPVVTNAGEAQNPQAAAPARMASAATRVAAPRSRVRAQG